MELASNSIDKNHAQQTIIAMVQNRDEQH